MATNGERPAAVRFTVPERPTYTRQRCTEVHVNAENRSLSDQPGTSLLVERLLGHGISPTRQRLQIARLMLSEPCHCSADEVMERLSEEGGRVSKATVYNTLGLFARVGLVREVGVDRSKVFYDSTVAPHHHFYNVSTGTLCDIPCGQIQLGPLPEMPDGTTIEGVEVVVRVRNRRRTAS